MGVLSRESPLPYSKRVWPFFRGVPIFRDNSTITALSCSDQCKSCESDERSIDPEKNYVSSSLQTALIAECLSARLY